MRAKSLYLTCGQFLNLDRGAFFRVLQQDLTDVIEEKDRTYQEIITQIDGLTKFRKKVDFLPGDLEILTIVDRYQSERVV